jgi:hypothetical protein
MEIAHLRQVVKSAMKITMKQMAEKSGRTIEEIAEAVFKYLPKLVEEQ